MSYFSRFLVTVFIFLLAADAAWSQPLPVDLVLLMPGDKEQIAAFTERLRQIPFLANSKEDVKGSNLVFVVSVAQVPTSGGSAAATTTGLLAASTLGLIPTVENKDISVHYELRANHVTIAAFDYTQNFTSVSNLFTGYGKMHEDARAWVLQTLESLDSDIKSSQKMTAIQAEYDAYFGHR